MAAGESRLAIISPRYCTLDQLQERKTEIEHALFVTLRDLFSMRVDLVFYDLTSTYFEGKGPPEKGANGAGRVAPTQAVAARRWRPAGKWSTTIL
jgi:hypothetical protein